MSDRLLREQLMAAHAMIGILIEAHHDPRALLVKFDVLLAVAQATAAAKGAGGTPPDMRAALQQYRALIERAARAPGAPDD